MRAVIVAAALAASACAPLAPGVPAAMSDPGPLPALWADPPSCVVVMPTEADPLIGLPPVTIEAALARHLSGRIDRVIGPTRRDALTRRLGLDLDHPADRARFAGLTGCRHAVVSRAWGGRVWGGVWAETEIGIAAEILDLAAGRRLWRGSYAARRGDGGLPLSPLSAVAAVGLAARAALDAELLPSVLDDAVRGALAGLADLRDPQAFASRNSSVSPLSSRK